MKKHLNLNTMLYVALVLALLASLNHVAFAFGTTNGFNQVEAYISAIAIDLGLLALAAGISKRKQAGRSTLTLWGGVVLFSVVSTYANWLAGIAHVTPITADTGEWGAWLVTLRPILLSGVLPSLVIYLSEIVSGNYQQELTEEQAEAKKAAKKVKVAANEPEPGQFQPGDPGALDRANEIRRANTAERRARLLDLVGRGMSRAAMANELGVSPSTIKRDLVALNGRAR